MKIVQRNCPKVLFLASLLLILVISGNASAYTSSGGVEDGDRVELKYELYVDGALHDSSTSWTTSVSQASLVLGFYLNVLGMKLNTPKSFSVPPDQGYTNAGHELYQKTLDFRNVEILDIVTDASPDDGDAGVMDRIAQNVGGGKLGEFIVLWLIPALIISGVCYALYISRHRFAKVTAALSAIVPASLKKRMSLCEICGAHQEGVCGKCGAKLCRNCFLPQCPKCKSNKFLPMRK